MGGSGSLPKPGRLTHLQLGQMGEDAAARWYAGNGYDVLARNWTCPQGEIDLVVSRSASLGTKRAVVAFVEVKTRRSDRYGSGFAAVTADKQRRLRRLAAQWLAEVPRRTMPTGADIRFDVVDVDGQGHVQVLHAAF